MVSATALVNEIAETTVFFQEAVDLCLAVPSLVTEEMRSLKWAGIGTLAEMQTLTEEDREAATLAAKAQMDEVEERVARRVREREASKSPHKGTIRRSRRREHHRRAQRNVRTLQRWQRSVSDTLRLVRRRRVPA